MFFFGVNCPFKNALQQRNLEENSVKTETQQHCWPSFNMMFFTVQHTENITLYAKDSHEKEKNGFNSQDNGTRRHISSYLPLYCGVNFRIAEGRLL